MAWWIEVRCENRSDAPATRSKYDDTCWSSTNEGGGRLANDTFRDMEYTARQIAQYLKKSGWRLTKVGWICPFCLDHIEKLKVNENERKID